jgi:hypothetical protein
MTRARSLLVLVGVVAATGCEAKVDGASPAPATNMNCNLNYTPCVPIASDVDCAGGSGDGPAYTNGPVFVVGDDVYGLDGNGDGVGCE